jgi:CheY-like chemotaxis protein
MAYLLIVDDDEDFAAATAKVLRDAGHEVEVELAIDSAIKSMRRRRPDLIVLDVMFPEDSSAGFTLAREIRHQMEQLKDVPVLMLTAVNQKFPLGFSEKDIDDHWLPVADFVEKPVEFDLLRRKVEGLLAKKGASSSKGE